MTVFEFIWELLINICRAYFRHLLRAVPAHYAVFFCFYFVIFTLSKLKTYMLFRGGFPLNLLKYIFYIHTARMLCLSRICPGMLIMMLMMSLIIAMVAFILSLRNGSRYSRMGQVKFVEDSL